jgi:hypothetical protein
MPHAYICQIAFSCFLNLKLNLNLLLTCLFSTLTSTCFSLNLRLSLYLYLFLSSPTYTCVEATLVATAQSAAYGREHCIETVRPQKDRGHKPPVPVQR